MAGNVRGLHHPSHPTHPTLDQHVVYTLFGRFVAFFVYCTHSIQGIRPLVSSSNATYAMAFVRLNTPVRCRRCRRRCRRSFTSVVPQGAGGITAAQLGKSAAGLAGPSPMKIVKEGVPRAIALAHLEQVSLFRCVNRHGVFRHIFIPLANDQSVLKQRHDMTKRKGKLSIRLHRAALLSPGSVGSASLHSQM